MVIVSYIKVDGNSRVKGSFTAPTNDIAQALHITSEQLVDDYVAEGFDRSADLAKLFHFTKAELAN